MHEGTTGEHLEALREERSKRLSVAVQEAVIQSGGESLTMAHGELCFHFDDGMTMQIEFDAQRKKP